MTMVEHYNGEVIKCHMDMNGSCLYEVEMLDETFQTIEEAQEAIDFCMFDQPGLEEFEEND